MAKKRQTWEPMRLVRVGSVAEVLRAGGGKLTSTGGDTGEPNRKPSGTG
jgi:hypothetical protein